MKKRIFKSAFAFALFGFFCLSGFSQAPRFQKVEVGSTGTFVYLPGEKPEFSHELSEDGSDVYSVEVDDEGFTFFAIVVKFKESIGDDQSLNEELLIHYLDYLQESMEITSTAGYGLGHEMERTPAAIGVIDFWEDSQEQQISLKGWVNGEYLTVLMIIGEDEYPNYSIQEFFFNSFHFPENQ